MDTNLVKTDSAFLRRLGREFDWFFDRFGFNRPPFETDTAMWTPFIEVFAKANELVVRAELPGLKNEDVKVEITDGELMIFGERKEEKKEEKKEKGFYRSEQRSGSFLRTIPLPEGVNVEKTLATMKDGVLEVKMPLVKVEVPRRRIEITEEASRQGRQDRRVTAAAAFA